MFYRSLLQTFIGHHDIWQEWPEFNTSPNLDSAKFTIAQISSRGSSKSSNANVLGLCQKQQNFIFVAVLYLPMQALA